MVNSALHGEAHSGLLRSSKVSRCRKFQHLHADMVVTVIGKSGIQFSRSLWFWCSAWDDPEFVEAVLRLVLTRLVDSQLGIFAMLNFAISIYAVGALTTKVTLLTSDPLLCLRTLLSSRV